MLNQDLLISYALAMCLSTRFEKTCAMNDCEEAISNLNRMVATFSPGNKLGEIERIVIKRISELLVSRVTLSPTPENLENAIHRIRTFIPYSLDDEGRTVLTLLLDGLMHKRFQFFGVTRNSGGIPSNPLMKVHIMSYRLREEESMNRSQIQEKLDRLMEYTTVIMNGETRDVEAAVEASRNLIPSQQSSDQWSYWSDATSTFASILFHAYGRTERLDYLNEAIVTYQDLHKISAAPKPSHFAVGCGLHHSLWARLKLLHRQQDFEELMQLSSELANDGSGEVFTRFQISCFWAANARAHLLPSASIAYETAMLLLQETLVFSPTLQTQHHRLADAFRTVRFPSDYASYQIEGGRVKEAIETMERARALIWSEMRGLRTSTDQLRAVDSKIADEFLDINRRLELVAMSVAQSDEICHSETGTGRCEDSIGQLVLTQ